MGFSFCRIAFTIILGNNEMKSYVVSNKTIYIHQTTVITNNFFLLYTTNLITRYTHSYYKITFESINSSSPEYSAQGQVLHCKLRIKAAVLLKGRSSTANSGTQVAVLLGMDRCGSFLLLSPPLESGLSLASEQILKALKRSQGHKRRGEECGFG